ncbi:hypothetical protein [Thermophilibacter sp.]
MTEKTHDSMEMPAEVDFSESIPNPYVGRVRKHETINIDSENVERSKADATRACAPHA